MKRDNKFMAVGSFKIAPGSVVSKRKDFVRGGIRASVTLGMVVARMKSNVFFGHQHGRILASCNVILIIVE